MRLLLFLLLLATMMADAPTHAQRASTDPAALAKTGALALNERRFGDALEAFTEAATLVPGDPTLCVGAGVAAFMLGQDDVAETWLQRALALQPRSQDASRLLGEVQYRAGRIRDAISTYEAALRLFPNATALESRLGIWRAEAQHEERSYSSRGAHFSVLFEGPTDDALARRIVDELEKAYWKVGTALTAYPPKPITVVLHTNEQFQDITRAPAWTAAVYDGRIRIPVQGVTQWTGDVERILTHEFVHAVVGMLAGRNAPVWLNEGLATAFERDGSDDADKVLARATVRPSLARLHGSFFTLSSAEARLAYAMSTHAVQRLLQLRGAPALVELLKDLGRGATFSGAFQQRLAMRYEDFQAMVGR
jgi:tetratricopeptide (TPR) repeat protein